MELLTLKKMGLSRPQVARGIDPHVPYRQSCITIDGAPVDGAVYSHDPVILDYVEGYPAFKKMLQGVVSLGVTGISDLCTKMVTYVTDRGGTMPTYTSGVNEAVVIAAFFAWIRQRMFLIWNGSEQVEMPLITAMLEHTMDSSCDAGLKMDDVYVTGLLLADYSADEVDTITEGGCVGFAVDMDPASDTSGSVILAAAGLPTGAGEAFEGWQLFPISGTVVTDKYTKTLDGEDYTFIDFVA